MPRQCSVNPNGVTRADSLARAENGAIVAGNAADVEALQVGKAADMSVTLQTIRVVGAADQLHVPDE